MEHLLLWVQEMEEGLFIRLVRINLSRTNAGTISGILGVDAKTICMLIIMGV